MESVEKTFLSELEQDQKTLKKLFSSAGAYDCPCRRKHMTHAQWIVYKNSYLHKIWKLLHERSFKYLNNPSDNLKKKVFNFYDKDVARIPCYTCRKHYVEYNKNNNLEKACNSRMSLCKFLIDLHNSVNKNTNKSEMSYEEVFKLYGYDFKSNNNVKMYPVMKTVVKQEPVKQEPVKQEPVKQEPVKQEPVKQEPVKQEPVVKNIDLRQHFMNLNKKLSKINKSKAKTKTKTQPINRNSIIKRNMLGTLNRL